MTAQSNVGAQSDPPLTILAPFISQDEQLLRENARLKSLLETRSAELARTTALLRQQLAERRKVEASLHESEHRFMTFMNNSPTAAFIKDENGRYVYGNQCWKAVFAGNATEAGARTDLDVYSREVASRSLAEDKNLLATGKPSESVSDFAPPGKPSTSWLTIKFPILDPHGRPFIAGIAVDITAQREREREILQAIEREQERIGQDLHDGLCQQLAAIKFKHALLAKKLASPSHGRSASAIESMLINAIDSAHRIARGLHPIHLDAPNLASALKELAANLGRVYHRTCIFRLRKHFPIHDNSVAFHLYRIAQEAIANGIKHGRARKIVTALARHGDSNILTIEDDGIGFPKKHLNKHGMGLHIMSYRARKIGANLEFVSKTGGGTIVKCILPNSKPQPAN